MKIGILGATGAVGRQMLQCIEERQIPADEIRVFASKRSVGKKLFCNGYELTVEEATQDRLNGLDFVLGAVSNALSKKFRPMVEKSGAIYIDNSSAFRQEDGVPLVVPEINGADALKNHGVIANPNCSTAITLMALAPINNLSKIKTINACTYQAVSGAGMGGIEELKGEVDALEKGETYEPKVFPGQIAFNVIANIGSPLDNGYTTEEMKMQNEGRKILHLPDLKVTCTCVRVPVMRSHSIAVTLRTERKVSVEEAKEAVRAFKGVRLIEDYEGRCYPTPLDTSNQDLVWVGRIREDLTDENGLTLWCCGDQIRKGAASNAVQILRRMIEE